MRDRIATFECIIASLNRTLIIHSDCLWAATNPPLCGFLNIFEDESWIHKQTKAHLLIASLPSSEIKAETMPSAFQYIFAWLIVTFIFKTLKINEAVLEHSIHKFTVTNPTTYLSHNTLFYKSDAYIVLLQLELQIKERKLECTPATNGEKMSEFRPMNRKPSLKSILTRGYHFSATLTRLNL